MFKSKLKASQSILKRAVIVAILSAACSAFYFFEPRENTLVSKLSTEAIESGTGARVLVWQGAINIWKKFPYFGSGPENFGEEFNHIQTIQQNYAESWDLIWHKAHNEYLHFLATLGSFGFAAYLLMIFSFGILFLHIFRKKEILADDMVSLGILTGLGYLLVTQVVAFSFIPTMLVFYFFPAVGYAISGPQKSFKWTWFYSDILRYALTGASVFALVFGAVRVYQFWSADLLYHASRAQMLQLADYDKARDLIDSAINRNAYNAEFRCFKADVYYNMLLRTYRDQRYNFPGARQEYLNQVVDSSDQCLTLDNRKVDFWRARGSLFMSMGQLDPKAYTISEESLRNGVKVYPNNPFVRLYLVKLFFNQGQKEKGLAELDQLFAVKKDYFPAFTEVLKWSYQFKDATMREQIVERAKQTFITSNLNDYFENLAAIARQNGDLILETNLRQHALMVKNR